jgi:hypothetical protein
MRRVKHLTNPVNFTKVDVATFAAQYGVPRGPYIADDDLKTPQGSAGDLQANYRQQSRQQSGYRPPPPPARQQPSSPHYSSSSGGGNSASPYAGSYGTPSSFVGSHGQSPSFVGSYGAASSFASSFEGIMMNRPRKDSHSNPAGYYPSSQTRGRRRTADDPQARGQRSGGDW